MVVLRLISGVSRERETFLRDIRGKVLWFIVSMVLKDYLSLRSVSRSIEFLWHPKEVTTLDGFCSPPR
jgi:hypothetical protein